MKTSKKVVCKCQKCNKPFSAYSETPLCKNCQMEKNIVDNGGMLRRRLVRTKEQAFDQRMIKALTSDKILNSGRGNRSSVDIARDLGLDI